MPKEKSFLKIGIIYTIGQALSKSISFILIPIYTRQLGTVGYGKLALADTVMDFISTFLIVSIFSGYIRFYREYSQDKRNMLRNTAINFAIIMAIIDIVFIIIFGENISRIVFNFDNAYKVLILIVVRSLIFQFITLLMCDYSLNYQALITVTTNVIMLVMNIGLSILFVVIKKEGIIGVYKGYIYSSSIILIYLIFKNIKKYRFEMDKGMLKNMLTFSGGLMPCGAAGTILTLADRYFLTGYRNYSETGVYSIGYKFGMLIDPIFISPFKSIFTPYKFEICNKKGSKSKINHMFRNYHVIGCFVMLVISLYSKIIIKIFTTNEYMQAWNLIPLIAFSYFIYGENEFFSLGIQVNNKTYITSIIMVIGGCSNILLNILLIPKYGMYGAAIATLISYIIINIINIRISLSLYEIKYNFKLAYKVDILTIILYCFYYIASYFLNNLLLESIMGILIMFGYFYLIVKCNVISKEEGRTFINSILNKFHIKKA